MEWFNEDIEKILISAALGAVIGLEREFRGKSAGFRTLMLVSIGSCLFTIMSNKMGFLGNTNDRIASNIVTGVSFLGAGLIFKEDQAVHGLTTAATVWTAAAIGMAVGLGSYWIALFTMALVWVVLVFFYKLQNAFESTQRIRTYRVTYTGDFPDPTAHEEVFRAKGVKVVESKLMKDNGRSYCLWTIKAKDSLHRRLVEELLRDNRISSFEY